MDRLGDIRLFVEAAQHAGSNVASGKIRVSTCRSTCSAWPRCWTSCARSEREERELKTLLSLGGHRPAAKARKVW